MEIIIFALPSVVGFVFSALLMQRKCKTLAERFMLMLMMLLSVFLLFDGYTIYPHAYSPLKVVCLIFNALFAPCIGISICFVAWSLFSVRQRYRWSFLSFYIFAVIVFLTELLNYVGFGLDRAAEYYANDRQYPPECDTDTILYHVYGMFEFFAVYVYNLVNMVSFAVSILFLCYLCVSSNFGPRVLFNFLFRRGPLRVLHVWTIVILTIYLFTAVRIYYGSHYLVKHFETSSWIYIIALFSITTIGWFSLNLRKPCIYLRRPHRMPMYDDLPVPILSLSPEDEDKRKEQGEEVLSSFDTDVEADSYRTLNVRDDMRRLMRDTACFLYPGQSRYYVADMLGLRRDSFDKTVQVLHHISYEEYAMVQRVEYCRRYRDRYSQESEMEISMACGFTSLEEMQYEWRECRGYFRRIDAVIEELKSRGELFF